MYDLAVIGGGPAGAAAAITAAMRGHNVLLLERGKYPRHKVCGEFVSAESLEILRTLISDGEFFGSQWERIGKIRRGRLFVDGSVLEAAIDPPAASISRVDLDYALWRRSMLAGVDAREEHTVLNVAHNSSFIISTGTQQFESHAVVDASGRWSNLRERGSLQSAAKNKKWIGLKAHFAEAAVSCSVDLYFFEGGYCGVQPLSTDHENRINACAMVRSDVARSLTEVFASHLALHARSRDWKQLTEVVTTAPLIFRTPAPERAGVLLAGDAAGFVDPFVGDGISLALRSGVMAADSLHGFFEGRETLEDACHRYRRDYCRDLMPVFRASSRIRRLFSLPRAVRAPMARFFQHTPSLTRYFVQKTR